MSKKEYSNGEVTVVWKPGICIHSAVCVKGLPKVFRPDEKPWIQTEGGSTDEIIEQVKKCPSGALSYFMNDSEAQATTAGHERETLVEVLKDGPLLVHGKLHVNHPDGTTEEKEKTTAFCRCGHSGNKPFCDGAHRKAGFAG
ncbi:(4Fe-4S)-binding protein [Robertkochia flava]|uniref:(4Fe-4S)-binding protein n=1 Tax=Robertkochia flava TaxID=3447986 RepID=UPI001CCFD6B4|nr:(4Fe-4S)-binding protein [Robertkochia marina]